MPIKSVVGVCGFGYSGSGAVLDLLKSYNNLFVDDRVEFSLVYTPDGIEDLQKNISLNPSRYWSSDSAIRRFLQLANRKRKYFDKLTKGGFSSLLSSYLNDIIQVQWKGSTSVHVYQESGLSYIIKQRLLRRVVSEYEIRVKPFPFHFWPQKKMYFSYLDNDSFICCSRGFVMNLLEKMERNHSETMVLDQPFSANNPEKSFPFFTDPKAIVVLRDPRDTYLLAKKNLGLCGSFVPTDNVEDFIVYYRGLMKSIVNTSTKRVLTISFEDLIYDYEVTKNKIEKFVGCKGTNNNSFFDPTISINNTQLWLKYPEYIEDVSEIENELRSFLYDFSVYNMKPTFNVKSF